VRKNTGTLSRTRSLYGAKIDSVNARYSSRGMIVVLFIPYTR
jgi:hypothetical protein